MKVIMIAGNSDATAVCCVNTASKKYKIDIIPQIVGKDTTGVTRINALSALVYYMRQIKEAKRKQESETATYNIPTIIYSVQVLNDFIENKTALYWLAANGKKLDGSPANPIELDLWKEFFELSAFLETDIIFKNISEAKVASNSNYRVSEDKRIINNYLSRLWETVNSYRETYSEIDEGEFI